MNVQLPFDHNPLAVVGILGLCVLSAAGGIWILSDHRKRKFKRTEEPLRGRRLLRNEKRFAKKAPKSKSKAKPAN
jgi:hypothetical protein